MAAADPSSDAGSSDWRRDLGERVVNPVTLAVSTGDDTVDTVLRWTIGAFASRFHDRIQGYYLVGSYATTSALATSDVDLVVVFRDAFTSAEEYWAADAIAKDCTTATPLDLSVLLIDEDELGPNTRDGGLAALAVPGFKLSSLFLYGHDIRPGLPLPPIDDWARRCMHIGSSLGRRDNDPTGVPFRVSYPDPDGEFYGYDRLQMVRHRDGTESPGTRGLVTEIGWLATALVADRARTFVLDKGEIPRLYRAAVADEWTSYIEALFNSCRHTWAYLIPDAVPDRNALRALCARVLGFENHFLTTYKAFLLAALRGDHERARRDAIRFLDRRMYRDGEIREAVDALRAHGDAELRRIVTRRLQALQGPSYGG